MLCDIGGNYEARIQGPALSFWVHQRTQARPRQHVGMQLLSTEEFSTQSERTGKKRRQSNEDAPQLSWFQAADYFGDCKVRSRLGRKYLFRRLGHLLLPAG